MGPSFHPFQLSQQLSAHEADVRSVFSPSANLIVSSSRDKSVVAWIRETGGWSLGKRWEGLGGFVGAAWAGVIDGQAYVVAGSQDALVNAFAVPDGATSPSELQAAVSNEPSRTAIGHSANVCCLDGLADGSGLVSGSWDKTAIVWNSSFEQVQALEGHSQTVWTVKSISPTQILTGSADKTIILWTKSGDKYTQTMKFTGHTDAVRCLVKIPGGDTFASAGNDGNIIVWSLSGDRLADLYGHTSFIYSLTVVPPLTPDAEPELASVSEDRTLRIWSGIGKNVQTIPHPAVSVWTVAATADGELVTGSSDGTVRVWTRHAERVASASDVKAYEDEVSKQKVDVSQQIGDVKKENVPGIEVLGRDGKKEGEVIMVKNDKNVVEAHQWSSATKAWQKIGEVVDAVGSGRKQLFDGREYDYVFDVDIAEGQPPLKLPYNASDNPFTAAQAFLQRNELPLSYLDQVVQFIETNTAKQTIGPDSSASQYVDPYTGASRYQSNSNSVPMAATGVGYVDPYSGTSRYTGGGPAANPGSTSAPERRPEDVLPVSAYLSFKQANVDALSKKVFELNASLAAGSDASLALTQEETKNLKDVVAFTSLPKAALPNPENVLSKEGWDVASLFAVLPKWPAAQRFPLIDLIRILSPVSPSLSSFRSRGAPMSVIEVLLAAAEWRSAWTATKERETNTLLALRALANLFGTKNGKLLMIESAETLFATFAVAPYSQFNKNIRTALATVLFNYSVIAVKSGFPRPSVAPGLLEVILKVAAQESEDPEAAYRLCVAFGNMLASSRVSGSLQVGKVSQGKKIVAQVAQAFPSDNRLSLLSSEIGRLSA